MFEGKRFAGAVVALVVVVAGFAGAAAADADDNEPPMAGAGLDQTAPVNATVHLDATGSSDPDGTVESYEWRVERPDGEHTTPDCETCARTEIRVRREGTYNATVTVTDDEGAERSDTMRIEVSPVDGPSVSVAGPSSVLANESVDLTATLTAGEEPLARVDWTVDGSLERRENLDGESVTDELSLSPESGTHTISVDVYDQLGRKDTATLNLTVTAPPDPPDDGGEGDGDSGDGGDGTGDQSVPTVTVEDRGAVVMHGGQEKVDIPASASDPDGAIVDYEWEVVTKPGGEIVWHNSTTDKRIEVHRAGRYAVRLTVTDDDGNTASDVGAFVLVPENQADQEDFESSANEDCWYPEDYVYTCGLDSVLDANDDGTITIVDSNGDGQITVNGETYDPGVTGGAVRVPLEEWREHYTLDLDGSEQTGDGELYYQHGIPQGFGEERDSDNVVGDWSLTRDYTYLDETNSIDEPPDTDLPEPDPADTGLPESAPIDTDLPIPDPPNTNEGESNDETSSDNTPDTSDYKFELD
jgi:hypothetical protein